MACSAASSSTVRWRHRPWFPVCGHRAFTTSAQVSLPSRTIAYKHIRSPVPYALGLQLQDELVAYHSRALADGKQRHNVLLLLEHPPTYTAGRRVRGTEVDERRRLGALGADYHETLRGGQTTFHGPGQLVGYPIFDLRSFDLGVRTYVSTLESMLVRLCSYYNITARTTNDTGVWVFNPKRNDDQKIAALGIQVRHHITSHGFALNCKTDLGWFEHIVPCGLPGKGITSLSVETGRGESHCKGTS
ncbi:uncharacterized protein EV422DRAFT_493905 [Fimicolochytrium jonesii]|uniref:uncharacterized protein n=1 Tax=Fimicolochytrium jonesii TaxID=1396493 RepID=UPI0022FF159D|nr:uncharacterized protein EV422DRAFT_493905 [Fimicolochytrium jonesii]KAI8823673.1 hypothetical protein EV422DRAFT_493905 [Fimicolochytrium jonesii]